MKQMNSAVLLLCVHFSDLCLSLLPTGALLYLWRVIQPLLDFYDLCVSSAAADLKTPGPLRPSEFGPAEETNGVKVKDKDKVKLPDAAPVGRRKISHSLFLFC